MTIKYKVTLLITALLIAVSPANSGIFDVFKGAPDSGDSSLPKEERALEHYRRGKSLYKAQKYDQSKAELEQAISLVSSDGKIAIARSQEVEWVETPRGLERRVVSDSTSYEYQPNQYLAYVNREQAKIAAAAAAAWQKEQANEQLAAERRKKFSNPPQLHITYDFIDGNRDGVLAAKESGKLVVTVENIGGYSASAVELKVESSSSALALNCCESFDLGEIAVGQSVVSTIDIKATEAIKTGKETVSFTATEKDGFGSGDEIRYAVNTQEYRPAAFEIVEQSVKHIQGNIYQVEYTVINRGKGPAMNAVAQVRPNSQNIYVLDASESKIGLLAVNASQRVSFTFSKNNRIKTGDRLPLVVRAYDDADAATERQFELALNLPRGGGTSRHASSSAMASPPPASAAALSIVNVDIDVPEGLDVKNYGRAFVIGNSNYESLSNVEYATNDSRVMGQYAKKTLGYKKVKVYEDQNSYDLRDIFGTKARQFKDGKLYSMVSRDADREQNPPVFIFYSGHGAPGLKDGKAYLVPVDARMDRLDQQGYPLEDLYAAIKALPTNNVTLVLDSCFSGNTDTVAGAQAEALYKGVSPAAFRVNELKAENVSNLTLFTSAAAKEVSYWHQESRHGLFTYNFLRALRGSADELGNKDGVITADEVHNFVEYEVAEYIDNAEKASKQSPGLSGDVSRALAKYQR